MSFIDFNQNIFGTKFVPLEIPPETQVIFVSDMFIEDYSGGAELTSEALLKSCPFSFFKLHSKDININLLEKNVDKYWIFGNFSNIDGNLIPTIIANLKYSIIEYDYKFCKYRSLEKHKEIEGIECNCYNEINGKVVSSFFYGAKSLFWMSERQMEIHHKTFPFLEERENMVLSSVFDDEFFVKIKFLREKYRDKKEDYYIIQDSPSWIKGTKEAEDYCLKNNIKYKKIGGLSYNLMLEEFAKAKGFVFLPPGSDTAPRTTIEAKLLNCELILNENVQHHSEEWFKSNDLLDTESYLYTSRQRFWQSIRLSMEYNPTISGYTTVLNCIEQNYPFIESITSLFGFCDEVVVLDCGSTDGTFEKIKDHFKNENKLKLKQYKFDYSEPRWSLIDGRSKAMTRTFCEGDFCWQQDIDEVVHEDDYKKIKNLVKLFPKGIDMLALPVIEFFGKNKTRSDIHCWKTRMTKNAHYITHGIRKECRQFDKEGNLYSIPYADDGCSYIHLNTYEAINWATFYTQDIDDLRRKGQNGDLNFLKQYENWYNQAINELPCIFHYSWFSLKDKMMRYKTNSEKGYKWQQSWENLFNFPEGDLEQNNMFFPGRKWSSITEEEINERAKEIENKLGGFVAHQPIDLNKNVPHIQCNRNHPGVMKDWIGKLK